VIPTDYNTFFEPPDTMDSLSTLFGHCDQGEVYLDVGELELEGSRSSHEVSEKFQRMLTHFWSHPTRWIHYRHCPVTATMEKSTSTSKNWNLMELGRPMRSLSDSNGFEHIFGVTRHDRLTIDTVQSLRPRKSLPRHQGTGT